jgi:very-short-patch-repair endonuclease
MSQPEALLWRALRAGPGGLQFRRQHPHGPYVFDFFCRSAALAIEIDGFAHDCGDRPIRDARRDERVREAGIVTLRIAARDVSYHLEGVITQIVQRCRERTPPPHFVRSPSPQNCGEDVQP